MKAKLKDSRILPIEEGSLIALNNNGDTLEVNVEDIDSFIDNNIDWEQRRYEIAKESITAIMSNDDFLGLVIEVESSKNNREIPKAVSVAAVAFADALIEELKKEKQHGN